MNHGKCKKDQIDFLLVAVLLVFSSHALPAWLLAIFQGADDGIEIALGHWNWQAIWELAFSLVLTLNNPVSYGFRIGRIRDKWLWVLVLCTIPILATWVVLPRLPNNPFSEGPICIWLISPLAQDLLFMGYFFTKFSDLFPGSIHKRVPFQKAILLTAAFFALYHVPGFGYASPWFITFQLFYTFLGACLLGVVRQWTDSFLYITIVHVIVNYIAVSS